MLNGRIPYAKIDLPRIFGKETTMKLGAQLYSLRDECNTPERLYNCFKRVKEIGYDNVQASGICAIEGERLLSYVEEFDLPIGCTHRPFKEIVENTDECIKFHKTIRCPVIGLGCMLEEHKTSYEGLLEFHRLIKEPLKKIKDAGLSFAYHNHAFEFESHDGVMIYDYLINEIPDLDFIHDIYWSTYADASPEKYVKLFGETGRMNHIHFKDMKTAPKGPICPCGDGVIDFSALAALCEKYGIEHVYVEQDNAPETGDSFGEMAKSYAHLAPIIRK